MTRKKISTTDAIAILHEEFLASDKAMSALVQEARMEADIAGQIRQLREKAGLTQRQLASLVKTTPSVISRLECADYQGHSLAMLHRIALALGRRLRVEFIASRRSA